MKQIFSVLLDVSRVGKQSVYLPTDAHIVTVDQSEGPVHDIKLFYLCSYPLKLNTQRKTFIICETEELIHTDNVNYLGHFKGSLGLRHVLECFD